MRSLADDLRSRSDEELAALVRARPDLLQPVPPDITSLAHRAGSPASVAACLSRYDQLTLHVVLAAALETDPLREVDLIRTVAGRVPGPDAAGRVQAAVDRLRADAMLWGDREVHLVGPARDLMIPADRGPRVAALDPVVEGYAQDPASVHLALASAPDGVRAALDLLLSGPVIGSVTDARRVPDPQRSPVDWLIAAHLLVPVGSDRVVLAAEAVSILREPSATTAQLPVIDLAEPTPSGEPATTQPPDPAAVGAILDVLHRTGELGRTWSSAPPSQLRTGGIALRDVTRTARGLGTTEPETLLLIELAAAAGLLATDPDDQVSVLPTAGFDVWSRLPAPEQHAALLEAWMSMPRPAATGDRPLDPGLRDPRMADLRNDVLRILATAPGPWRDEDVVRAVDWWAPRRHDARRAGRVRTVLEHCRTLGILVDGTLTGPGQALTSGQPPLSEALASSLPHPVDAVILQADMTAIVPGLPTPELADLLRAVADVESVGAASTYRFSTASIRRALARGHTAQELLAQLRRRGPVPQPLAFMIEDVARRHAPLRIGRSATYLRCDDPVVLAQILADPAAAPLGLRALSDTVLMSSREAEHVLRRLQDLGHAPVPEPGAALAGGGPRRARRSAAPAPEPTGDQTVGPALAAAAVRAIRATDRNPAAPHEGVGEPRRLAIPDMTPTDIAAGLRSAIGDQSAVWIGYCDPTGVASDRRIEPLRLAGGFLTALDLRSEAITTYALARITGVSR